MSSLINKRAKQMEKKKNRASNISDQKKKEACSLLCLMFF